MPQPNPITDADAWRLIPAYLADRCTPSEREALEAWIAADPAHTAEVELLRASWNAIPPIAISPAAENLWQRIRPGTARQVAGAAALVWQRRRRERHHWTTWVTALAIVAASGLAAWQMLSVGRSGHSASAGAVYATNVGQHLSVTLVDGTRVTLGPASRLQLSVNFARGARTTELEGEAYFTVAHDARRPFSVHARNAVATDIGTQFDVRAYADDDVVRITVAEGRVGLAFVGMGQTTGRRPVSDEHLLSVGDAATVSDTALAITHNANVARLTSWLQGGLAFDATPLRDVVRDLERTFNIDVTIADSTLGSRRITATFGPEESLDAVLNAMTAPIGAQYQRFGRRVVIRSQVTGMQAPGGGERAPAPLHVTSGRNLVE